MLDRRVDRFSVCCGPRVQFEWDWFGVIRVASINLLKMWCQPKVLVYENNSLEWWLRTLERISNTVLFPVAHTKTAEDRSGEEGERER